MAKKKANKEPWLDEWCERCGRQGQKTNRVAEYATGQGEKTMDLHETCAQKLFKSDTKAERS
jgi:hypothetical protein